MENYLKSIAVSNIDISKSNIDTIVSIEQLEDFDDEYVYDLCIDDTKQPVFFGNDILLCNSAHFTLQDYVDNVDDAVGMADAIAEMVNENFVAVTKDKFLVTDDYSTYIKVGRELVSDRGLYLTRKKYILHVVVDDKGKKIDKLKLMGDSSKKSDTPKRLQDFLKQIYIKVLKEKQDYLTVNNFIKSVRDDIVDNILSYGMPKSCNNLEKYFNLYVEARKDQIYDLLYTCENLFGMYAINPEDMNNELFKSIIFRSDRNRKKDLLDFFNNFEIDNELGLTVVADIDKTLEEYLLDTKLLKFDHVKCRLPGHIKAAIMHNYFIKMFDDVEVAPLSSGDKLKLFYVNPDNIYGIKAIAFAYEVDEVPKWFLDRFEIDIELMQHTLIEKKLDPHFRAMNWPILDNAYYALDDEYNTDAEDDAEDDAGNRDN